MNLSDHVKNLRPMIKITMSPQDEWCKETYIIQRRMCCGIYWAKVDVRKENHKFLLKDVKLTKTVIQSNFHNCSCNICMSFIQLLDDIPDVFQGSR